MPTNDSTFGVGVKPAPDPKHRCVICGGPILPEGTWLEGHNAAPVAAGRCCRSCNDSVVLPARLGALRPKP